MITKRKLLERISNLEFMVHQIRQERKLEQFLATNKREYLDGPIGNQGWVVTGCYTYEGWDGNYYYKYNLFNTNSYKVVTNVTETSMSHYAKNLKKEAKESS